MGEGGIVLHKSSIGGKFFTSSDLIPFSLRDFLASFISSSFNTSIPLFLGVVFGVGSGVGIDIGSGISVGEDQSSWFLLILAINSSASSSVLFLKTPPAELSREVLDSTVSPL